MKKKRLIPVILYRDEWLVQSKSFSRFQKVGKPIRSVLRYSEWDSDELIYLNISNTLLKSENEKNDINNDFLNVLDDVSKVTFMPLTVGGGIQSNKDIQTRLALCADKVSINTAAIENPEFIYNAAREFGSQCIVISIDAKRFENEHYVMSHYGKRKTNLKAKDWAKEMEDSGCGEILINSVDNDGKKSGYDIELIDNISKSVNIPVIALGGVGELSHFAEALEKTDVDAIAAANIFQYMDQSVYLAKKFLTDQKYNIRQIVNK